MNDDEPRKDNPDELPLPDSEDDHHELEKSELPNEGESEDVEFDFVGPDTPLRPKGPAVSVTDESTDHSDDMQGQDRPSKPTGPGTDLDPDPAKPTRRQTGSTRRLLLIGVSAVVVAGFGYGGWQVWDYLGSSDDTAMVGTGMGPNVDGGESVSQKSPVTTGQSEVGEPAKLAGVVQPDENEPPSSPVQQLLQQPVTVKALDQVLRSLRENSITQQERQQIEDWAIKAWGDGNTDSSLRMKLTDVLDGLEWFSRRPTTSTSGDASTIDDSAFFVAWVQQPDAYSYPPGMSGSSGPGQTARSTWDFFVKVRLDANSKPADRIKSLVRMAKLEQAYGGQRMGVLLGEAEQILETQKGIDRSSIEIAGVLEDLTKLRSAHQISSLKLANRGLKTDLRGVQAQLNTVQKEAEDRQEVLLDIQGKSADLEKETKNLRAQLASLSEHFNSMPGSPAPIKMDSIKQFVSSARLRLEAVESDAKTPLIKRLDGVQKALKPEMPVGEAAELITKCQSLAFDLPKLELDELMPAATGEKELADKTQIVEFLNRLDTQTLEPVATSGSQRAAWEQLNMEVQQLLTTLDKPEGLSLAEVSDIHVQLDNITTVSARLYADKIVKSLPASVASIARKDIPVEPRQLATSHARNVCGETEVVVRETAPRVAQQIWSSAQFEQRLGKLEQVFEDQVTGVVQRALDTLADYGYVPPSAQGTGNSTETPPTVAPQQPTYDRELAGQAFANGVGAYFSHDPLSLDLAFEQLQSAVKHAPRNPIYRHFLAITLFRLGRLPEASAQAYAAIRLESGKYDRQYVARSLERIQGPTRTWLERQRFYAITRD